MRLAPVPTEWPDRCRRGFRGRRRVHSIAAIAQDYVRRHQPKAARELQSFRNIRSLEEAITQAGLARRPDGKRWSHQRRIPVAVLERATQRLRRGRLESARSFADLIGRVSAAVRSVRGVGELYRYDTALRIGAHLRVLPREVYLHAGTRVGARAIGLDHRAESVSLGQLPVGLRRLQPHEVEDVLCIYKDWLATAKRGSNRSFQPSAPRVARRRR